MRAIARRTVYGEGVTALETRPVTRAHRGFGQTELVQLDRDELRMLCHALLLGEGATIENYRVTSEYSEFLSSAPGTWRPHRIVVRLFYRAVGQADLDGLIENANMASAVEALVISAEEMSPTLTPPLGVHLVSPNEFANRITSSPIVEWIDDMPRVSVDRLGLLIALDELTGLLDPIGIQWLPSLALNELPAALATRDVQPQDLLERKTFRVMTASYRFGGVRYGEAERGKRLPDSVLHWPDGSPTSAIIDCKAASSGYRMDPDHLLRFIRYWEVLDPMLAEQGKELEYLIVVSSHFPGSEGDRHPFNGRAAEIMEKTGLRLAYVSASDLAWWSAQIEASDMSLSERAAIDWRSILDSGLVTADAFREAMGGVG